MITTGITTVLLVGVGIGALTRLASSGRRTGPAATVLVVVVAAVVGTAVARVIGTS